jgi:hypothetical protein
MSWDSVVRIYVELILWEEHGNLIVVGQDTRDMAPPILLKRNLVCGMLSWNNEKVGFGVLPG